MAHFVYAWLYVFFCTYGTYFLYVRYVFLLIAVAFLSDKFAWVLAGKIQSLEWIILVGWGALIQWAKPMHPGKPLQLGLAVHAELIHHPAAVGFRSA